MTIGLLAYIALREEWIRSEVSQGLGDHEEAKIEGNKLSGPVSDDQFRQN